MSEATTQPVVDKPDAQPLAGAEGADARTNGSELDSLLNQYDQETRPSAPATPATPQPTPAAAAAPATPLPVDPTVYEVKRRLDHEDMSKLVTAIRGDLPDEVFDFDFVRAWVAGQAEKDTRLEKAWKGRFENPKAFEQVQAALGREFAKKMGKLPDRQATEDREAVAAAVRGASRSPVETPPNYSSMPDGEFQKAKEKAFGG
jgi:hypothetical protein